MGAIDLGWGDERKGNGMNDRLARLPALSSSPYTQHQQQQQRQPDAVNSAIALLAVLFTGATLEILVRKFCVCVPT